MDQKIFQKIHPIEHLRRFLLKGVRPDGRAPSKARKVSISTSPIGTAVGSAMLKLGRTTVVAGVHATLIQPPTSTPDQGVLDVNVELLSMAAASLKPGRTSDESLCLTEFVRGLIAPHIDMSKLCVEEGLLVWRLRLTMYCIDHDGNIEDATLLAAVAAMRDVKLPNVRLIDDDEVDGNGEATDSSAMCDESREAHANGSAIAEASVERPNALQMDGFPIPISFVLFEGKALMDPCAEEEAVSESRVTFLFRPSGELRGVLKPGGRHISEALYRSCVEVCKGQVSSLVEKLGAGK
eukprot:GFKZ01014037.1.p2 GENE.GFKZ01014037.1~~GFKZ01014037.1.p2  ORF type:complete len:295 (+),score=33.84 GFKZ01014037.1:2134-3018(+)